MYASKLFPINETTDFRIVPAVREAFLTISFDIFERVYKEITWFPTDPDTFVNIPEKEHMVYWTENHLAGILTSEYLIAQQLGKKLKHRRLETFLKSRVAYGSSESFSGVYQPYTLAGLLNVVDFCLDPELVELARHVCDTIVMQYASVIHPFTGSCGTAASRHYSYMRTETKNLKIAPLCDVLVGRESSLSTYSDSFTLAHALRTTSYKIPTQAFETIRKRREPGVHEEFIEATKKSLSYKEPVWILWSYGEYAQATRIFDVINFVYESGISQHHHFKSVAGFLSHPLARFLAYVFIGILFCVYWIAVKLFLVSTYLTGMKMHVITMTSPKSSCCIVTSLSFRGQRRTAAQQLPLMINIDDRTFYAQFGQPQSGVKKEISSMAILPVSNIKYENKVLTVDTSFRTFNPLFWVKSRGNLADIRGFEEGQTEAVVGDFRVTLRSKTSRNTKLEIDVLNA
jgi:hypothetical protein